MLAPAERIARTVETMPDNVAITDGTNTVTYRQLWAESAALGEALAARLDSGSVVAVLLPRDAMQAMVIISCVRFGLPLMILDPSVPTERLRRIAAQAPGGVAITSRGIAASDLGPTWTAFDPRSAVRGECPAPMEAAVPRRHDPVVLIATSGTSGRPKLVAVDHAGLHNRVAWACRRFELHSGDRVVYCSAPGFDFGLFEVLSPLYVGGTLVVPDREAHRDPAALLADVRRHEATVLHGTPSMLRHLSVLPELKDCTALRLIFSGGEALSGDLVRALAVATLARIVNEYGPTETTIDSLAYECEPDESYPHNMVPLGMCIDRTDVHVDAAVEGETGELLIGGVGVARGYYADPRATALAFVPDDRTPGARGARLYRSGDLCYRDSAGLVHFVGRGDDQVKVRGVRIELAEVTAAYRRHPLVLDVIAGGVATPEGTRLAMTVEVADDTVPAAELRRFTSTYLPRAFQPDHLEVTEVLPRQPNGKADRQAVESAWTATLSAAVSPRLVDPGGQASEQDLLDVLLSVACESLGLDQVNPTDNFFAVGGHSLLGAGLAAAVQDRIGRPVPLRFVFDADTFAEIAELTERWWHDGNG